MLISRHGIAALAAAAIVSLAVSLPSSARAQGAPCGAERQHAAGLSDELGQPAIARLHLECPLLGRIVEEFALRDLGELANPGAEGASREVATVAVLAGSGDVPSIKRHAEYALQAGATRFELKEILYLTALYAGIAKAIEATRALADLLDAEENEI